MSSIVQTELVSNAQRLRSGRQRRKIWTAVVSYVLLIILMVITLIPIVWMVLTSFKSEGEVSQFPPTILPQAWHLDNFAQAWNFAPFGQYLLNTLLIAGSITLIQTITCSLAAYAFARLRFRFRDALFLLYLATLMVPSQVTVIPLFILMRNLNWIDTYHGLIIPQAFSAFGTFLLRQFFLTIPFELEDSARIDGASRLRCFVQIIVPLSGTALATLAVFIFLYHWNNLLWPLIMANSDATFPIAVGLRNFQGQFANAWNLLMAAATLATIPVIALYLFTQRWFVKGIVVSGFGGR
ncbi:MAG: carbohydrate ABC transporter permease [Ktedonobacteraceae bacterium]